MRKALISTFLVVLFSICAVTELRASPDSDADEPFDMGMGRRGPTWREWQKIIANVEAEMRELAKCRTEPDRCNAAERRFETSSRKPKARTAGPKLNLSMSGLTVKSVMNRIRHNGVSRMPGRCPLMSTKRVLSARCR